MATKTLTITYSQPVNNSANVTLANVNVNVAALSTDPVVGGDYSSIAETILIRGLWVGTSSFRAA